ncbi:MAG: hypothetical protein IPP06_15165 [Saprospiraceae bacterium]|nr:hypothetical protein [Candidatus Vicinibacter affinis]
MKDFRHNELKYLKYFAISEEKHQNIKNVTEADVYINTMMYFRFTLVQPTNESSSVFKVKP